MSDLWLALKNYLYGIGWLLVALLAIVKGFHLFSKFCPIDIRREIENKNMAAAVMVGLFLFGLSFGILYFLAHVQ